MRLLIPLAVLSIALAACSGTDPVESADPAARGRQVVEDRGCIACHGDGGEGVIGPAWVGLAGSPVELEDGSVVTADREYLRRSILDPGAQVVAGTSVSMPRTGLTEDEVDDVVAYIESLSDQDGEP